MNNLNSVIIEGNLVRQAELKEPADGFKVCTFCVAVNRWYKNSNGEGSEEVSYFDVKAFGPAAERAAKFGEKGRGVRVVGRLKQDRWKDENEKSHSFIFLIAEHIEFKPMLKTDEKFDDLKTVPASSEEEAETESDETASVETEAEETVF